MPSRDFCPQPHKSPNVHAVFGVTEKKHVFNAPLSSLLLFFSYFLSPKMWGLLRPKISQKNTKTQIPDGKTKLKTPLVKG